MLALHHIAQPKILDHTTQHDRLRLEDRSADSESWWLPRKPRRPNSQMPRSAFDQQFCQCLYDGSTRNVAVQTNGISEPDHIYRSELQMHGP